MVNTPKKNKTDSDILKLIKGQHKQLKESIDILKNENAAEEKKQKHLSDFIDLLKMHSEAEEATLYAVLKDISSSQMIVLEAHEEHSVAKYLVQEIEELDYLESWSNELGAKAKVLAELVEHHANEEEIEMFDAARDTLTKEELQVLGEEFEKICQEFEDAKAMREKVRTDYQHDAMILLN